MRRTGVFLQRFQAAHRAHPKRKLTPESIREIALKRQDIHYPKPRVVTLTQATEVGSVYTPDEIRAISAPAKSSA